MKYNVLGNTGVLVSELCFGTMTFGGEGFWKAIGQQQQDEADELLKIAYDSGINFIDTANVYSFGQSEEILGNSIDNLDIDPDELFIATKVRGAMSESPNNQGLSRYHIFNSVEQSLERMDLEQIDLLYVHGVDHIMPIREIMRSLNDVVESEMVRYVGVCNWPAWMVAKAQGIARKEGWHEFNALQYYYSLAARDIEEELIPMAQDENLPLMPWSPLSGGYLAGKYDRESGKAGEGARRNDFDFPPVHKDLVFDVIDELKAIGENHNVSPAEVALAWLRHQQPVTSTIIGAKNVEQLKSNIHSVEIDLSADELTRLNEASALPVRYPKWMVDFQSSSRFPSDKTEEENEE